MVFLFVPLLPGRCIVWLNKKIKNDIEATFFFEANSNTAISWGLVAMAISFRFLPRGLGSILPQTENEKCVVFKRFQIWGSSRN